jgi:uncharacterized protein DUF2510
MAFDANRLKFGDMIAGGSAIALFIFMLFPWYKASFEGFGTKKSDGFNAWSALGGGDLLLLLLILIVLGAVVARAVGADAQVPVPLGPVILGAGALAALYILYRIIDLPGDIGAANDAINAISGGHAGFDIGRSFGIFLSFIAALGMAAGGFLSLRERGEAIPGVGGPLGGGAGGGGPLGGGQPAGGPLGGGQPVGGQPVGGQPVGGQPAGGVGAASAGVADPGAQAAGQPKADWYPDPQGQARLRYWDGSQWTDQTAD